MRKKILSSVLSLSVFFALGTTTFASSLPTSTDVKIDSSSAAIVTPYSLQKAVRENWGYNKAVYPTLADIPQTRYYNDGTYSGTLTIDSAESVTRMVNGIATPFWNVYYQGIVTAFPQ